MKKLISLLIVTMMLLSITACNEPSIDKDPNILTFPAYEEADEYTLVFTNEGMSLDLDWSRMNKVIQNQHKNADMMNDAFLQNQEYYANLIQLKIVVYNYDNLKDTGIQTTLTPNISLLYDTDITVHTKHPGAGKVTYLGDKYPIERLHQMQRLGFERYGIQITGVYKIGYGDTVSSEYTFKLQGRLKFEDETDKTKLHTGKLTLTDTGATLDIKYADLLDEFGYTLDDLQHSTSETVETLGVLLYTSKREAKIGTMDILKFQYTPQTRPETIRFQLNYDRAEANNNALMQEHMAVGQELYAELTLTLTINGTEYSCIYFIRCDMT